MATGLASPQTAANTSGSGSTSLTRPVVLDDRGSTCSSGGGNGDGTSNNSSRGATPKRSRKKLVKYVLKATTPSTAEAAGGKASTKSSPRSPLKQKHLPNNKKKVVLFNERPPEVAFQRESYVGAIITGETAKNVIDDDDDEEDKSNNSSTIRRERAAFWSRLLRFLEALKFWRSEQENQQTKVKGTTIKVQ